MKRNEEDEVALDVSSPDSSKVDISTRRPYGLVSTFYVARDGYRITEVTDGSAIIWKADTHSCEHVVTILDKRASPSLLIIHTRSVGGGKTPFYYEKKDDGHTDDHNDHSGPFWAPITEETFYKEFDGMVQRASLVASVGLDVYRDRNSKRFHTNNHPDFPFEVYAPNVGFHIQGVSAGATVWNANSYDERCLYASFYPRESPILAYIAIDTGSGVKDAYYSKTSSLFSDSWNEISKDEYLDGLRDSGLDPSKFDNSIVFDISSIDTSAYTAREIQLGDYSVELYALFVGFRLRTIVDDGKEVWKASEGERCTYINLVLRDKRPFTFFILIDDPNGDCRILYYYKDASGKWKVIDKTEYYNVMVCRYNPLYTHQVDHPRIIMSSFRNKQGLKIATYSATVDNSRADIILCHGLRSHFKSEFLAYDNEWNFEHLGPMLPLDINGMFVREWKHKHDLIAKYEYLFEHASLEGMDVLEVSPRYEYNYTLVELLNRMGYNVYGFDIQAHGLSEAPTEKRCYVKDFKDYVHDLLQFISIVRRGVFNDPTEKWNESMIFKGTESSRKTIVWGHSMGANVAIQAIQEFHRMVNNSRVTSGRPIIDGLISTSGMFNIDFYLNTWYKKAARPFLGLLALLVPEDVNPREAFSNCGEVFDSFIRHKDPFLRNKRVTFQAAALVFSACDEVKRDDRMAYYPRDLPTLFIQTKNDMICSIDGSRELVGKLVERGATDVKLVELDGTSHYLTLPHSIFVYQRYIEEWLEQHT